MRTIFFLILFAVSTSYGQWTGRLTATTITTDSCDHSTFDTGESFNASTCAFHTGTISGDRTIALAGFAGTGYSQVQLQLTMNSTGGYVLTLPGAVAEALSVDPTANSITILTFWSTDAGVTIHGSSTFSPGIPLVSKSADYTITAANTNGSIYHPSSDANARTFTIPANATVKFPVGTTLTFVNLSANSLTIAITSDTMTLLPAGTTGSRTLAQYGVCTAYKVSTTAWTISGTSTLSMLLPELLWAA